MGKKIHTFAMTGFIMPFSEVAIKKRVRLAGVSPVALSCSHDKSCQRPHPILNNQTILLMTGQVKTVLPVLLSELKATDPKRIAFDLQAVRAMAQHSPCWSLIELSDKERIGREFERIHLLLQELAVNPEI